MVKKNITNKKEQLRDYIQQLKKIWWCALILMPCLIVTTYVFATINMKVWLAVVLNVIIGGFICLLAYIIFDKIERKRKIEKFLDAEDNDPFSK